MNQSKAFKEVAIFFAITLSASFFVFWGPLALFQVPTISFVSQVRGPGWAIILLMLGGFVPSSLALFLTWKWEGGEGLRRMGRRVIKIKIGGLWYLAAVVIVLFGSTGEIIISRLVNGDPFDLTLFVQQLGSFLPLLIIGPLSEEIGWRGYAQDRLQKILDPIIGSVILGIFWALWHLPLFIIVGTAQHELGLPFLPFLFKLAALSVCYGWLHNNTGRSVWTAIFFHWMYTYSSQVVSTGTSQTTLLSWLSCIPYMIAAAVVIAAWKTRSQPEMREARAS
jgi:uncharacterized protein